MFTHTSVHSDFSWLKIKSTRVNLKCLISIHSKSIRTQNFLVQRMRQRTEVTHRRHEYDTHGRKQAYSNTLTRQQWAWMTNRLSDFDIPELTHTAHIHMYVSTSWPLSFLLLSLTKNFLALTYKHTPLFITQIYEYYYLFICYLSSCDKVKLFCFFLILVFVNFLSFMFVCTNCVVYCGTGSLIYILEKYLFLHICDAL